MNRIDLQDRVAGVTGGAQGIGLAIAERLLRSGARVVVWDIDAQRLRQACEVLGALGPVRGAQVDLTDDAAVAAATAEAELAEARLDILVNNAGITGGNGCIVNVTSVAGKEGNPNASHYSASKAGLIALTKSLAKETATRGVLVNAVTPAAARTALFAQMTRAHVDYMLGKIPMGRFVEVQEIAAMVAWLASEDCSFSTGAVFDISGGRATY